MKKVTAFLFEGPCDGETMPTTRDAKRIEIMVMDKKETHVYSFYSGNLFGGDNHCRIFKFQETVKNE